MVAVAIGLAVSMLRSEAEEAEDLVELEGESVPAEPAYSEAA
jgi:hypothetical protein